MQYLAYSDGSGSAVAEESTNSADVAAYTLSGSQCVTEDEGLLIQEGGDCLPLATSDVCVLQEDLSESPSEAPSLLPSLVPTGEDASDAPTTEDASGSPTVEIEISASPMQQLNSD